ncbi:ATP-dependent DNA helicase RecG [Lactobacillus sp. S2-2]|uniref:ATP-dependent DNA helicase RecG n=1 Tax=Lactobacillus sp. S2-2 TaxID=2692917 RepID=UPI001F0210A4|nr:ATP-dependent DNA helicase RecG [Lactobacillus sp. S2-2]
MDLRDNISVLNGIGPKRIQGFNKLNIFSINDLLNYFPYRYQDFTVQNLDNIQDNEQITIMGDISSEPTVRYIARKKSILRFSLKVDNQIIFITFFNQPWLINKIKEMKKIIVFGKYDAKKKSLTGLKILDESNSDTFESVYPSNKLVSDKIIKKTIEQAYNLYKDKIENFLPDWIIKKYKLANQNYVIKNMHFPDSKEDALSAKRTAKFNEFFLYQLSLQLIKTKREINDKYRINIKENEITNFENSLKFVLTNSQKKVLKEILSDLDKPYSMNRLLQGDVGSGKTVIAALSIYANYLDGNQSVLMAPTEILAEQHADSLSKMFEKFPINIALLTGSTKSSARKILIPKIENGSIDLLIGTHTLFQDEISYNDLKLSIIDEQHRFGVNQRKKLREKGASNNILAMTATPIPRTLTITNYGQMDLSIIDELPKGRQKIITNWIRPSQFDNLVKFLENHLEEKEQVYVVVPLIEESENLDMNNVNSIFNKLNNRINSNFNIDFLHGQMKENEKNEKMELFKNGEIDILVSTTVIEVGVDISNASIMVIYDADHFGLSQLHQLRGRVGRGTKQSYCILISEPKNEIAAKRMQVMCESNDGFYISQKDLELRGSGEILGDRQSGFEHFKIGDPISDFNILVEAQKTAKQIVSSENWELDNDNLKLIKQINLYNEDNVLD